MRIALTIFAVALLTLPWLKLIGAVLLLWIGVKLLLPEDGEESVDASDNLIKAIKTILIADLVMSLDNVIAVAAAAGGSIVLLVLGLGISIPLVIFGSTLLLRLMERWPIIITIGAGLLGFVAGEMAITDPAIGGWVTSTFEHVKERPMLGGVSLEVLCGLAGAAFVVALGTWLARRKAVEEIHEVQASESAPER
jgi:YjbE family integral membrane protein